MPEIPVLHQLHADMDLPIFSSNIFGKARDNLSIGSIESSRKNQNLNNGMIQFAKSETTFADLNIFHTNGQDR